MITDKEYIKANIRLEELLKIENIEKSDFVDELIKVSDIVEEYEEEHYKIGLPTLKEVIELRMFEMKIKQKDLALLLNTSASRISEVFRGKREITLSMAKLLHKKLNIDSDIILQ